MEYKFIKKCNADALKQEIETTILNGLILSCIQTSTVITVNMSRSLNEREFEILYKKVQDHKTPSIEEQMTKERVLSAIAFGQSIIVEVATENIMLKLTTNDILYILTKFAGLKSMLESGSLYTALAALQAVKPDHIMTQERLNKYIGKLKTYLGVP